MKDILGAACSGLCMVHCLVFPAAMAVAVPLVGVSIFASESVHIVLSILMIALAFWAFPSGWRSHGHRAPGSLAVVGVGFLLATHVVSEHLELYVMTIAGLALIAAHLLNRYLLSKRALF